MNYNAGMTSTDGQNGSSSGLSLAIRLRDGSPDAWRELVDLYGPLVDSWCRRAGLSEPARADVGQDVFLSVHRGIGEFDAKRPGATFRGWLWIIARNAVLAWQRRNQVQAAGGSTAQDRLAEVVDPWGNDSSVDQPTTGETASLLQRALAQIRPTVDATTWDAFWNMTVLGRSAPDVADELGLSAANVRQIKSRMLRRLRQQLGDR